MATLRASTHDCGWGCFSLLSLSPLFLPCLSVFLVTTGSRWSLAPGALWTQAQVQLCAEAALASVTAFVNRPAGVVRPGPGLGTRTALLEPPSPSSSAGPCTSRIKPLYWSEPVLWSGELTSLAARDPGREQHGACFQVGAAFCRQGAEGPMLVI